MTNIRSFREVYEEYKHLVYNLSLQYVHHSDDAQDITQEVFVKIHDHLHEHDGSLSSLKTWIYRITINHNLDFIKAKRTQKRFAFITSLFGKDESGNELDPGHFDHPGVLLEDKEELERLFSFIDRLPEKQRTAIILMKIEDRSQKEAAEIMNITPKALESLVQRAKQSLSSMMERRKQ
ncbi:MAG: RNA polymerase sigma factor [Bacteroidetes bacterium]|nr:RNA polymerase sigma factor [Bacteroidota bacterium]